MRRSILLCLAIGLSSLGVSAPAHAWYGIHSYLINDRIQGRPAENGEVFVDTYLDVYFAGGRMWLSQSPDGSGPLMVDDAEDYLITRPDGTSVSFTLDHQRGCAYLADSPPQDITALVQHGFNQIHVVYRDVCGGSVFADPHWVVNTQQQTRVLTEPALATASINSGGVAAKKNLQLVGQLQEFDPFPYPITGEYLHFSAGGQELCAPVLTNDEGIARCDDPKAIALAVAFGGYTVTYNGNPWFLPSSPAQGELVRVNGPTS